MILATNIKNDIENNIISCDVGNDSYVLAFDNGGTLCEVIINDVGNCDYDDDLIESIIDTAWLTV